MLLARCEMLLREHGALIDHDEDGDQTSAQSLHGGTGAGLEAPRAVDALGGTAKRTGRGARLEGGVIRRAAREVHDLAAADANRVVCHRREPERACMQRRNGFRRRMRLRTMTPRRAEPPAGAP